jgi:hypothetical protein
VAITTHKKITIYITKGGGITELKVEHEIENIVETEVKVEHEIPAMTSHLLLPVLDPTKRIPYQVSEKPLFNRSPCFNDKACVIGLEDVYSIHNAMFEHYNDIPYNPPKQVEPEPVYNLSSDPSTPIKLDNDEALVIYKIIQTDESRVNKCVYEKSIKTKKDDLLKMTWNTLFGQIGLYDGKPYGPTSVNGIPTTIVPVFYINSSPIISNSLTFDTMDIKDILSIKNENLPIKIGLHLYKLDKKLCFVMPYDANCHINAENL